MPPHPLNLLRTSFDWRRRIGKPRVSGAIGQPKPKPCGRAGLLLWLVRNRLRARFTGGFRVNPFFDTAAVRPIVPPQVLSPAQRERLADSQGA